MFFLSKKPLYIGIETTSNSARFAIIEYAKKEWRLLSLKEVPLTEAHALLLPLEKKGMITTVLSQRQVMVRTLQMDLKKKADVYKALEFQIEPHLPFTLEEAILQTQIKKTEDTGFTVTVFALKEDALAEHLEAHALYRIEPDAVTSHALALAALMLLEKKPDHDEVQCVMNIGEKETTLLLLKENMVLDQRSFLTEKTPGVTMQKAFLSLENANPKYYTSALFLFGKDSESHVRKIQELTRKKIHTLNSQIENLSKDELGTFAIAIGTALSQAGQNNLNFRQKKFKKNFTYKFIKKPLFAFCSLLLISTGLLAGGGHYYLQTKKTYTQQKLLSLLAFREMADPHFTQLTSLEEYQTVLDGIEESIANEEQDYALAPSLPQVSEILEWLAEEIMQAPPPLKGMIIDSFDYTLVSRPTPLLKNERYQVDIALSFSAHSPNIKEAFTELLQRADFIINSKLPIEVSFNNGKGRAHFTLKDGTRYG